MQLTTTDKKALNSLNPIQRGLVEARLSTPFRSLPKPKQMEICLNMVTFLHSKTGDKGGTDPNLLQFQAGEFFGELKGINGELTESEIFLACEGLYRGEWGQFFGLNAKTYNQLLSGFRTKEERGRAWLDYIKSLEETKPTEMTIQEKEYVAKSRILKRFSDYKNSGNIGYCPHACYDLLNEWKGQEVTINGKTFKTLCPDNEVRKELWKRAKKEVVNILNKEKFRQEARGNLKEARQISEKIAGGLKDTNAENIQKELLLRYYFDQLIKSGEDLTF